MTPLQLRTQGIRSHTPFPGNRRQDLLVLTHRVPYPPDKGDRIRTFHLLKHLAGRAAVHLACLADEPPDPAALDIFARCCTRVAVIPLGPRSRWVRAAATLAVGRTATEGAFDSPSLRATLRRWAAGTRFHSVLASASSLVPYLRIPELRGVPAVVDLIDVDSQKWLDYAAVGRGPRSWLYRIEGKRLRRVEHAIAGWARALTVVSEAEAELYRRAVRPDGSVHAITNGVDLDYFRPLPEVAERPGRCVFVGALDYRPNIDAACWFARTAWPEIRRRHPGATLALVGRNPSAEVRRLAEVPGIDVVGPVPDVRPRVAEAAVAIAPLRIARGVQNKVLEALAMGKAVVASPQALEGLRVEPGMGLLAASDPGEWAHVIATLLGDPARRRDLGAAGRRFVEDHHGWETCLAPFATLLGLGERTGSDDSGSQIPGFEYDIRTA